MCEHILRAEEDIRREVEIEKRCGKGPGEWVEMREKGSSGWSGNEAESQSDLNAGALER